MDCDAVSTFDDIVAILLPEIDEGLASHGESLPTRPHRAATFIVEHCIVEISGESKDKYLTKPWFGALLAAVIDWYRKVYGEAMKSRPAQSHTAVVAIRSTPTALDVPLTVSTPIAEDNTFWITFAASVLPGENPLDWLVRPPKLSELSEEQLKQATSSATSTSELVRRISNGLMTIGNQSARALKHASLVLPHLQAAAQNILQPNRNGFSSAIWEANFATENAIKCHLLLAGVSKVPSVHDVRQLDSLAADSHRSAELEVAVSVMPSGKDAVKHRYGELGDAPMSHAMEAYRASLVVCRHYANAIPPKMRLENARLKMKVPPMPPKSSAHG
ncbi:hypothetical protein AB4Z46_18805 [Variovorax sp. M-6]|uniref:hypothetical protein n=1 Tax=Variovorax sp. M-6 TaxID=3233041 RepID=UPI003F9DDA7E